MKWYLIRWQPPPLRRQGVWPRNHPFRCPRHTTGHWRGPGSKASTRRPSTVPPRSSAGRQRFYWKNTDWISTKCRWRRRLPVLWGSLSKTIRSLIWIRWKVPIPAKSYCATVEVSLSWTLLPCQWLLQGPKRLLYTPIINRNGRLLINAKFLHEKQW